MQDIDLCSPWYPIVVLVTYFRALGQAMMVNNAIRWVFDIPIHITAYTFSKLSCVNILIKRFLLLEKTFWKCFNCFTIYVSICTIRISMYIFTISSTQDTTNKKHCETQNRNLPFSQTKLLFCMRERKKAMDSC